MIQRGSRTHLQAIRDVQLGEVSSLLEQSVLMIYLTTDEL